MLSAMMPDINPANLSVNEFGIITIEEGIAKEIAKKLLSIDHAEAIPLPVFEATLNNAGDIAALSFQVQGRHLMVDGLISYPENVRLMHILSATSGDWYTYVDTAARLNDKTFTILNMSNDIYTGELVPTDYYKLLFLIKDGGAIDLDKQEDAAVWGILSFIGVPVTGVTLTPSTLNLALGSSFDLSPRVNIIPSIADYQAVTWSSNSAAVAVNWMTGVVTANGLGTGVITVTTGDGGYTATCTVTVP
jgi:hypothetical protein